MDSALFLLHRKFCSLCNKKTLREDAHTFLLPGTPKAVSGGGSVS